MKIRISNNVEHPQCLLPRRILGNGPSFPLPVNVVDKTVTLIGVPRTEEDVSAVFTYITRYPTAAKYVSNHHSVGVLKKLWNNSHHDTLSNLITNVFYNCSFSSPENSFIVNEHFHKMYLFLKGYQTAIIN